MGILRLLLALSVLFAHAGVFPLSDNTFADGLVAVECFFLISGFYMALILNERYISLKDFYVNRFLRIFPIYWLILCVVIILTLINGKPLFISQFLNDINISWFSKLLAIFSNLLIMGSDLPLYFATLTKASNSISLNSEAVLNRLFYLLIVPASWSLPLELSYYLIAPFLVKSPMRLLMLIFLSLICRYYIYKYIGSTDPWNYRFFPSELLFFGLGSFCYHIYIKIKKYSFSEDIGFIFFVIIFFYLTNLNRIPSIMPNTVLFRGEFIQFFLCMTVMLPFIFLKTKNNLMDRRVGELSYPIYLAHILIIKEIRAGTLPKITSSPVYDLIIYVVIFALLINYFFKNIIEYRFKREAKAEHDVKYGEVYA